MYLQNCGIFSMQKNRPANRKSENRQNTAINPRKLSMYRTSGVIFFIDYCTAIRDTQKEGVEEKETSYQVHRILGHAYVA